VTRGGNLYAVHQGVFFLLMSYVLVASCTAPFAFDGLAEDLGIGRRRRAVPSAAEAVLLWGVVVAGHPEDVLGMALATWAPTRAFQGRWTSVGWLFGAAVAVQPLVIVLFPLLVALGGRNRVVGLVVRGAVPAAVVLAVPLVADAHDLLHAWVDQPTFPNIPFNYKTIWTPPPPVRAEAAAPRRWAVGRSDWWPCGSTPHSVMTAYYSWPALAVGVLIAGRAGTRRFLVALVAAAAVVVGQWLIDPYVWWAVQVAGVTIVLAAAVSPLPAEEAPPARKAKGPSGRPGATRRPARR
jgi:hypothetical protein